MLRSRESLTLISTRTGSRLGPPALVANQHLDHRLVGVYQDFAADVQEERARFCCCPPTALSLILLLLSALLARDWSIAAHRDRRQARDDYAATAAVAAANR